MIVCVCWNIADREIERRAREGCASFEALQDATEISTNCGACEEFARDVFEAARLAAPQSAAAPGCPRQQLTQDTKR